MKITAESTNENGTKHIKFISDIAEYKRIVTSNIPRPRPFLTPARRSPVSFTARVSWIHKFLPAADAGIVIVSFPTFYFPENLNLLLHNEFFYQ